MPKTYSQLYIDARKALRDAGIEAHSLESRLLICHATGKTQAELLRDMPLYSSNQVESLVERYVRRRLLGEPVAYITGRWEFYGLPLEITPDVLIPRSDTEVLVDKALELIRQRTSAPRILDLCCGSGCIGLAMAHTLSESRVVMLDLSRKALEVTRRNIRANALSARAVCMEADALIPPADNLGSFDIILSNPPYIASSEIDTLDSSVRDYEPRSALDGGEDGLTFYRFIAKEWKRALRTGGWMIFEVGETQSADVQKIMRLEGFKNVDCVKDSAGINRVVFGRV